MREITREAMQKKVTHYDKDNRWGNSLEFFRWEVDDEGLRRISGHKRQSLFSVGDWIAMEMESGRVGVFEVVELDWMRDPIDMFFGKVKDVGYATVEIAEV